MPLWDESASNHKKLSAFLLQDDLFQIVTVHPEYQRQGICGALVYEATLHAFEKMHLSTLVMVADEEYHATNIYKSVGFSETEKVYGVCKY